MSLVKGFTDILTPVNRWVDSAFTRGGGYDSTLTFSSISPSTYPNISQHTQIGAWKLTASNVTVTRNNSIISVTLTIDSTGEDEGALVFRLTKKPTNIMGALTIGAELVSLSETECSFTGSYGGSSIGLYNRQTNKPGEIGITSIIVDSSTTYYPLLVLKVPPSCVGKTISFSFKNPFIYEGNYTNPPYKESLDCSPLNPFVHYLDSPDSTTALITASSSSSKKWLRCINLSKTLPSYNYMTYTHFMICKPIQSSGWNPTLTDVQAYVYFGTNYAVDTRNTAYGIDAVSVRTGANTTNLFSKFRFAKDTSGDVYVEAYCDHGLSNNVRIRYICVRTNHNSQNVHRVDIVPSSFYGDDDTIIGNEFGYRLPGTSTYIAP